MSNHLIGRLSRCTCGDEKPSSKDLPFFEFTGAGTSAASLCRCGYAKEAHGCERDLKSRFTCGDAYAPRGAQPYDRHYCGCRGWD